MTDSILASCFDLHGKRVRLICDIKSEFGVIYEAGTEFIWCDGSDDQRINGDLVFVEEYEVEKCLT